MRYAGTVLPILRDSRERLMEEWGLAEVLEYKDESAASAVTKLDIEIEHTVSKKLASSFPDIVFVGEEAGGDRKAERFWLMDPIDGTAHYIRGLPLCTSMLALVENGKVVFGAIYDFVNDRMYFAEKGEGAFCDDVRMSVSSRQLSNAYIGFETHYEHPGNLEFFNKLRTRSTVVRTITAGWELAMVAAGKLDARICYDPYGCDYDYAPGTLLVAEAGGVVANIASISYDYTNLDFIAANPVIFDELTRGKDALFPLV